MKSLLYFTVNTVWIYKHICLCNTCLVLIPTSLQFSNNVFIAASPLLWNIFRSICVAPTSYSSKKRRVQSRFNASLRWLREQRKKSEQFLPACRHRQTKTRWTQHTWLTSLHQLCRSQSLSPVWFKSLWWMKVQHPHSPRHSFPLKIAICRLVSSEISIALGRLCIPITLINQRVKGLDVRRREGGL